MRASPQGAPSKNDIQGSPSLLPLTTHHPTQQVPQRALRPPAPGASLCTFQAPPPLRPHPPSSSGSSLALRPLNTVSPCERRGWFCPLRTPGPARREKQRGKGGLGLLPSRPPRPEWALGPKERGMLPGLTARGRVWETRRFRSIHSSLAAPGLPAAVPPPGGGRVPETPRAAPSSPRCQGSSPRVGPPPGLGPRPRAPPAGAGAPGFPAVRAPCRSRPAPPRPRPRGAAASCRRPAGSVLGGARGGRTGRTGLGCARHGPGPARPPAARPLAAAG